MADWVKIPDGDPERGDGVRSWPVFHPSEPRKGQYFLYGNKCGCCPMYCLCVAPAACIAYFFGMVGAVLLMGVTMLLYLCCACPGWTVYLYTQTWSCAPWRWDTTLYERFLYLYYQTTLLTRKMPDAGPEFMPVSEIRPKEELDKYVIPYAIDIFVPKKYTEEFGSGSLHFLSRLREIVEENLTKLPILDRFDCFAEGEDPVQFVANQLGSVYPPTYQVWDDKQSDMALTRFCLYGLGAHRIDTEELEGTKYYVVRTNALASLDMRTGFERYGGDAYFDLSWRPVKIVDEGLAPLRRDGHQESVTTRPGEKGWERAKFRFRSSLSVLVTLVDHLYEIHLQASNLFVTALREKVSADHPMRRFMTPFTYMTVSVNADARNNLVRPGSMAPRCFGFTDDSLHLAFAAAPKLVQGPAADGPVVDRIEYIKYLKEKKGIDTEYNRQCLEFALIVEKFVVDYMASYYPTHADVVRDPEMLAMAEQYFYQHDSITYGQFMNASSSAASGAAAHCSANSAAASSAACSAAGMDSVEDIYKRIVSLFVNVIFQVTVGHEQVGAIEVYVQDASWCAFSWVPGATAGTKQAATSTALLMSFTSTPMPKLLGDDWTHLFLKPSGLSHGAKSPEECFRMFQEELQAMSQKSDAYCDAAASRPFPECFPLYVVNPKYLETSISV